MQQRKHPRIDLETEIRLVSSASDSAVSAWIQDLSQGGMKLKAKGPSNFNGFRSGDEVHLKTDENFFSIRGRGRVSWVSQDLEMIGIEFVDLDKESRKSLVDFLKIF